MPSPHRRTAGALVCALALTAAGAAPALAQDEEPLPGYTEEGSARQLAYEERFRELVDPGVLGEFASRLARRPQLVGSPGVRRAAELSVQRLRRFGLDAQLERYDVYLSRPESIEVTQTAPGEPRRLSNKERPYEYQEFFDEVVVGYNAYSPAGDVSGEVVYANYGRPEDFEALEALGVDVRDKVVLVRYGQNFRGVKSKQAEERGARGVLIYSDPEDSGFTRGPVYPDGPWKPADAIERGSVQYIFQYPGDPLTPFEPSVPGTERIAPEEAENLPRIPTTPISYGDAEPLLRALEGPEGPEEFQGGLPFRYRVGPGGSEARLDLDIAYEQTRLRDVVATIPGAERPEEKVVIGGHYDGWTYGADDNTSAWATIVEIGRVLSRLLDRGWRPERTIVLAGWDGEEYGLLGSTEWVEEQRRDLTRNAVAYLNMDGVAGREFGATGVPALDEVVRAITRQVGAPGAEGTVYESWRGDEEEEPQPDRPGSGSDYTAFLDHIGVPIADLGFSTPGGEYHTSWDDNRMVQTFLDPGYLGHAAAAQVTGLTALRLANAEVVPLRYSAYAEQVTAYVEELRATQAETPGAAQVDLAPVAEAAAAWGEATAALEEAAAGLVASEDVETRRVQRQLRRVNRALRRQERLLTREEGLPERPWFRHQVYAPGLTTGYAVQVLPGLQDAVAAGDAATAERWRDLLVAALHEATAEAVIAQPDER